MLEEYERTSAKAPVTCGAAIEVPEKKAYPAFGTVLIIVGWITLYRGSKRKERNFVAGGIYKYSRHPQYLGFILVVFGWFIDWPTLITLIFAPILIYKYVQVCRVEEKEILAEHPEYSEYMKKVPFFI